MIELAKEIRERHHVCHPRLEHIIAERRNRHRSRRPNDKAVRCEDSESDIGTKRLCLLDFLLRNDLTA